MKTSSNPCIALKSSNIFIDHESDPISGLILVSFEEISDIISINSLTNEILEEIRKTHEFYDLGDSFIFPGIIDLNVHLNSNYEEKWSHPTEITRMAAKGGITTIIDNPLMNSYNAEFDESKCIKSRIKDLEGKLCVDCGLLGYIGNHNYKNIKEIFDEGDVLGFKLYLSKTMIPELPFITKQNLKSLFKKIEKHPNLHKILLAFDCVYVTDRERSMCSPMRGEKKENRFDLSFEIKKFNKFAGGVHEVIETSEEMSDQKYISDIEIEGILDEYEKKSPNQEMISSEIDKLRIKANLVAKSQKENAIANLELVQYNQKFSINTIEEDDADYMEEKEEEKLNKSLSTDQELYNDIEASGDEDYDNSTTTSIKIKKVFEVSSNNERSPKKSPPKLLFFKENPNKDDLNKFEGNPLKESIRCVYNKLNENENEKDNDQSSTNNYENKSAFIFKNSKKENEGEKPQRIIFPQAFDNSIRPVIGPSKLLSRRMTIPNLSSVGKKNLNAEIFTKLKDLDVEKEEDKEKEDINNREYNIFLANHSLIWESNGVKLIFKNLKVFKNVTILFSNLSSMSLFFMVKFFNEQIKPSFNVDLYTEVCTPYLYFHNKMIKASQTKFKNCPPIRIKEERDLLTQGLKINNLIDVVSSFHMSNPPEYKRIDKGNFRRCFNGLSCIGFNLQILWTKLYIKEKKKLKKNKKNEKFDEILENDQYNKIFKELIKKLCVNPAKIIKLDGKKGVIKKGFQADFVVWNPYKIITIDHKAITLSPKLFLFNNIKLYGEVTHTFLRGKLIYKLGEDIVGHSGRIIRRT